MASGGERRLGTAQLVGGAAGLAVAGGLAAAWVAQHRAVRRGLQSAAEGAQVEELVMPADVDRTVVETPDGTHIHVAMRGSGSPLLLLHGLALSSDLWVHQFSDLADHQRVVAPDLRGHGRSDVGSGGFDAPTTDADAAPAVARMADDVRVVVERLDLRDALLVGHSMGGMVALELVHSLGPVWCARHLRGLVLVDTTAGPVSGSAPSFVARIGSRVAGPLTGAVDRLSTSRLRSDDVRWWISRMGFGPEAVPAQVQFVERLHHALGPGMLRQLVPSLTLFDRWAALFTIELPTLVVVGSRDRLTGTDQARRMADRLPHAQSVELPRCGHMPMRERRREFSHLLEEFAAKLG